MTNSFFDLSGRTALITGGGSGLGKNIAEVYAEYGANIAVCSRKLANCQETAEDLEHRFGIKAKAYECDVSNEQQVEKTVAEVLQDFGAIDILSLIHI